MKGFTSGETVVEAGIPRLKPDGLAYGLSVALDVVAQDAGRPPGGG